VFVIEDIDCLTNVVYQRGADQANELNNTGDGITLSFLLNLLDGVLETPGRILVITSNYPEKLDSALVRPGRIDVRIQFERASRELIREMINNFYSISLAVKEIPTCLERKLTPAEVLESLCNNFKDHISAIRELILKSCQAEVPPEDLLHVSPSSDSVGGYSIGLDQAKETKEIANHLQGVSRVADEVWAANDLEQSVYGSLEGSHVNTEVNGMDAFFQPLLEEDMFKKARSMQYPNLFSSTDTTP
jgi:hypothetical protein